MTDLSLVKAECVDGLQTTDCVLPEPKYPRFVIIESALLYLPNDKTDWKSFCEMGYDFYSNSWLANKRALDSPARIAMFALDSQPTEYKENNKKWHQRLREVDLINSAQWGVAE
jgi:hypothetical protein